MMPYTSGTYFSNDAVSVTGAHQSAQKPNKKWWEFLFDQLFWVFVLVGVAGVISYLCVLNIIVTLNTSAMFMSTAVLGLCTFGIIGVACVIALGVALRFKVDEFISRHSYLTALFGLGTFFTFAALGLISAGAIAVATPYMFFVGAAFVTLAGIGYLFYSAYENFDNILKWFSETLLWCHNKDVSEEGQNNNQVQTPETMRESVGRIYEWDTGLPGTQTSSLPSLPKKFSASGASKPSIITQGETPSSLSSLSARQDFVSTTPVPDAPDGSVLDKRGNPGLWVGSSP